MPQLPSPCSTLPGLASSVLAASLWLLPGAGLAFAVRDLPNPRQSSGGWVSDGAGILRQDTETRINGMIDALERQDGSELIVVTVPDTSGSSSPKTFSTELFNTFKIGKKGVDNGVLMLISKGDRRVEIETGYGMEERLPDARAGAIIATAMLPRFKQGDFDGGTLAGVGEVIRSLSPEASKNLPVADKPTNSFGDSDAIFAILVPALLIISFLWMFIDEARHGFPGGDSSSRRDSFSSSDSDSSSGSDRGSGGGGSSGGGGAGGSW